MISNHLDFVAVGPFKTGTTWIHDYLLNYQQVALPTKVKETFFFDQKFELGLDWYYSHFTSFEPTKMVGEIAPSYFHSPEAPQRIYDINPDCKILVTLREPVSRLFSYYSHMQQRGEIKPEVSFTEALSEQQVLRDTALYYFHLCRWIETFGSKNVKVAFFETLQLSPDNFAQVVLRKLGIEEEDVTHDLSQKVNVSQVPVNYHLSRIVYSGVNFLHDRGLHKVVEYGKNIGIRQLLVSQKSQKSKLSPEEFMNALDLCKQDVLLLESKLNFDLSEWKKIWSEKATQLINVQSRQVN
jgi:hypothetical protein